MPKNTGNRGAGGNSRVRFIMLDADLSDGDLNQFTQAIANAIRPGSPQRALPALPRSSAASVEATPPQDEVEAAIEVVDDGAATDTGNAASTSASTSQKVRTYRSPKVLDIDLNAGSVSWAAYVDAKNPPDEATKHYLVALGWFKEYGGVGEVTIDHVYTAFKRVKWSTQIEDFDLPLRQLVKRGWVKRVGRGKYQINHLGLAELENMGSDPVVEADAAP